MDNGNGDVPATSPGVTPSPAPVSAEDVARRVRDAADSAVKDVKNAAMHGVEGARAKAGDAGHTTASRLRDIAGQMSGEMPWLSDAFRKSAEGLDSVTTSLTRGDIGQSVSGLADFARRQPAVFLGASVALGFALARVGKTALEGDQHGKPDAVADSTPEKTNGLAPQHFEGDAGYGPAGS